MSTPQDQAARQRTGWIMIMSYVNNPQPSTTLRGVDDPVLTQASRDAVFWLGVNLVQGKTDGEAYENAYSAALHSAQDAFSRAAIRP